MCRFSVILALLVGGGVTLAGEAVSGVNGKLDYSGGNMDSFTGHNVSGSASLPLASNLGLQVDGLYTHVSDRDFYGAGVHLFWRDWDKGLLGITAATVQEQGIESFQGGLEAEYYLDKFTFAAQAGLASIEYDVGALPFIDTDVTDFYGEIEVRYYPWADLMVSGVYAHVFDNELLMAQLEYLTPVRGLSLVAEVAQGEHDYDHALLGARLYLGAKKNLKRRHREDDPPNAARRTLYGIGSYGAEYNRNERTYSAQQGIEYTGGGYGFENVMVSPLEPVTPEDFRRSLEDWGE